MRAGQYAYRDRRNKKREFRALWITRINAGAREAGVSYSQFMAGLKKAGIDGVQLSFFDFMPDLEFFGARVLPLLKQAGLRN